MSTIAQHIHEVTKDGMRFFASHQTTKDVLTIEGSVPGGPSTLPRGKGVVAQLTAELLDAGTKTKSKDQFRKLLADKGISLSFNSSGARTYFSASALPEDLGTVLGLIVECLTSPLFDADELALAKERALGEIEELTTDTRTQASIALARALYEPSHPNYADTLEETVTALKATTRKQLVEHAQVFGKSGLVLAIVGDVAPATALALAEKHLERMPQGSGVVALTTKGVRKSPKAKTLVPIADKANVDTFFASALELTYEDARFIPLSLAVSMLGGRGLSTGHLMRTIRERDGLTYGIYGSLSGFDDGTTGFWRIWGTFAPTVFKKALGAVDKEIKVFLAKGVTEKGLATKKQEVAGSYQVALSTSHGLANTLHKIGREGKPLSYIDDYIELVNAVTLADVKKVAKLLVPEKLSLAAAGTFEA